MLWPEVDDPYERFRAAAAAGFTRVERLFVHDLDTGRVRELLDELGLKLVLFDPYPGDWLAGDRGMLALPGRESELRESVLEAVETATSLGTQRLNVLSGLLPDGVSRDQALEVAVENLDALGPIAGRAGVSLVVEPINDIEWPGYSVPTVADALRIITMVGDEAVGLQFDAYHVGRTGESILERLDATIEYVGHVQIADVPGRHQPGTGTLPLDRFLERLDDLGYTGAVGLEYIPEGSTADALAWLPVPERR
jgi:hydroxypyruvate isomerase